MQIGKPALPDELVDREEEVKNIVSKMRSKINYNIAMLGYRRIGKSSILSKAAYILSKDDKIVVVYFDVQKFMGGPKSFLINLQSTIFNAYVKKLTKIGRLKAKASRSFDSIGKIADALYSKKIKGIAVELTPGASAEDYSIMPKIEFKDKDVNYMTSFLSVFKTINALAEKNNMKFIIILDEFQEIIQLRRHKGLKNILELFRSIIQERSNNVSYVICGSHVHLLRSILSNGKSALFSHFTELSVGEMNEKNSKLLFNEYVMTRGLKTNDKMASEAYSLVGGQPYYLMALAEAWEPGKKLSEVFWNLLSSSVGSLRLYAQYVLAEGIAIAQGGPVLKSILEKLAMSDEGLSYSGLSKELDIPTTSIVPYVNELVKTDLIIKEETLYKIRDNIIRQYLRLSIA
jgi:AAA+ ATPase superfamily predicted ATPase